MDNLRVAVIGTGYLGSIHAKLYKEIPGCSLIAVCDVDKERLQSISSELGVPGYSEYKQVFPLVDAVSIAAPTRLHYKICRDCLQHNIHTLVEKPFTSNLKEADKLIELAEEKKLILQVGHIERFNSAFAATQQLITEPKFIESHRLSPFPNRSLDVGVVLDLMIHDIDLVLDLVTSEIKEVSALGLSAFTKSADIATSRRSGRTARMWSGCPRRRRSSTRCSTWPRSRRRTS